MSKKALESSRRAGKCILLDTTQENYSSFSGSCYGNIGLAAGLYSVTLEHKISNSGWNHGSEQIIF